MCINMTLLNACAFNIYTADYQCYAQGHSQPEGHKQKIYYDPEHIIIIGLKKLMTKQWAR